jgi:hypothetical protein
MQGSSLRHVLDGRDAPLLLGFNLFEMENHRVWRCWLNLELKRQRTSPLLAKLAKLRMKTEQLWRTSLCSTVFTDVSMPVVPLR